MKNLQGKDIKRGQHVIAKISDGIYEAGIIHQLYDRTNQVRISGYALTVPANKLVDAGDAWEAVAKTIPKEEAPNPAVA